jgi:hypothetical protein
MATFLALPGHEFWPDDLTLMDDQQVPGARLLDSTQVTDTYLVTAHGGKLATFDPQLVTDAVPNGQQFLYLID